MRTGKCVDKRQKTDNNGGMPEAVEILLKSGTDAVRRNSYHPSKIPIEEEDLRSLLQPAF